MNILLLAHEKNLGGASKSLVTLAKELQEKGNSVIVVVPFKSGQVYEELKKMRIQVHKIFFPWWMMPSYWNWILKIAFRLLYAVEIVSVVKIARLARKEKIQIIHSNSSVIDVGAIAAKMTRIPHVWHFREFGDIDYRLEYLKGKDKSIHFVTGVNGKVIFISKSLREHYSDGISEDACRIIYNGIPNSFLCEKEYRKTYSKIIFLIAGNFHRNKGQKLVLQAAKTLIDKGIDNFEIWVAGQIAATTDSHKYEKELQEYAQKNLRGFCRFLGFVSDMKTLRQKTDVELVCSNMEAFGRVTIEAMMSGNPVIGTDTGANLELITDGETGRLFQNGNVNDLADKMNWFIEEKGHIRECGRKAYLFAKDNFLSSRNTKNIEKLYQEMVTPRKIGEDCSVSVSTEEYEKNLDIGVAQEVKTWDNLAEQSRAEQSRAEQSRAEQSRAEQRLVEQRLV